MRYLSTDTVTATRISRIGLGTWQFGSREWGYGQSYAGQEAHAIVRRAVELGVTSARLTTYSPPGSRGYHWW